MREPTGIACRLASGVALIVLGACAGHGERENTGGKTGDGVLGDLTSAQGAIILQTEAASERTTAFTFVVRQGGDVALESVRPLQEAYLPDSVGGPHTTPTRFADAFFVLAAGSYDIEVIPMVGNLATLAADNTCTPGFANQVMVEAGRTSEILVVAQCDDPRGGMDIVAVINHPPVIVDVKYGPSKLISPCEILTITSFADDADSDPIEYDWQVVAPAEATFEMLPTGSQLIFRSETLGTFEVTATVCDALPEEYKGCSERVLPIHVVGPASGPSSCDASQCMELRDFVAAGCTQVGCQDDPECAVNCTNACPCQGASCPPPACAPDCNNQECGSDPVCGTSCGTCPEGETCNTQQGQCAPDALPCVPDCSGRDCGPDPICGEDCGTCAPGTSCDNSGVCEPDPDCTPDCTGRVCGVDPACGESCGTCPGNDSCTAGGQCVDCESAPQVGDDVTGAVETDCNLPECGDGIMDEGEECDDGNDIDGDGCQGDCTLPECGDGIMDEGEQCDDGNLIDGDGCRADCTVPECGDGIVDEGEQCDDGNDIDGDGCQANCALPECGDGVMDEGEQCDDGNDIDGDGCYACEIECGLSVEKFCSVPRLPPFAGSCEGKALSLVFVYTGESCANPLANPQKGKAECADADAVALTEPVSIEWAGRDERKMDISPSSGIGIDTSFVVTAPGRRHQELPADSKFEIRNVAGEFAQYVKIHSSCSKPLAVGDVFGSFMLIELTSRDGGTVSLPEQPPSPDLAEECLVEAAPRGSCDDDRPKSLVFKYTAEPCSASSNDQRGKGKCSGSLNGEEPVEIIYKGKDAAKISVTPSTNVSIGEFVTVEATGRRELHSKTKLEVRQGSRVFQKLEIHTSCSQPLNEGDQFGSLLLEGFIPKGDVVRSENVVYTYRIANNGQSEVEAFVEDDKLDIVNSNILIHAGEMVELTEKVFLTVPGTVTNIVTVTDVDDPSCSATDEVTVEVVGPPPPPFECKGAKPIQTLSMIWAGPDGVDIITEGGQVINGINSGDEVSVSVADLGNEVDVTISGAIYGMSRFHVSCSDKEMNGAEDCGNSQGDGKRNDSDLINSWIFEGMAGNGSLECTP